MLVKSGANIVEAARQLGHSPTVLLDTYVHVIDGSPTRTIDVQAESQRHGGGWIELTNASTGITRLVRDRDCISGSAGA
jgi:hypothetical protein